MGLSRNAKIVAGSLLVIVALLVAAGFAMSLSSGGGQGRENFNDFNLDQANNTAQPQLDVPAGVNLSASGGNVFANLSEQTTLAQSSGSNATQVQNMVPTPTPVVSPNTPPSNSTNNTSESQISNGNSGSDTSSGINNATNPNGTANGTVLTNETTGLNGTSNGLPPSNVSSSNTA